MCCADQLNPHGIAVVGGGGVNGANELAPISARKGVGMADMTHAATRDAVELLRSCGSCWKVGTGNSIGRSSPRASAEPATLTSRACSCGARVTADPGAERRHAATSSLESASPARRLGLLREVDRGPLEGNTPPPPAVYNATVDRGPDCRDLMIARVRELLNQIPASDRRRADAIADQLRREFGGRRPYIRKNLAYVDGVHPRKSNPDNEVTPQGRKWLLSLPPDVRPISLVEKHPQIVNLIALAWDNPSAINALLTDLLVDARRTRWPGGFRRCNSATSCGHCTIKTDRRHAHRGRKAAGSSS